MQTARVLVAGCIFIACKRPPTLDPDASPDSTLASQAKTGGTTKREPVPSPSAAPATPPQACEKRCNDGKDCPSRACHCEDGSVVTMKYCHNDCCAPEEETCSHGCEKHDGPAGTWNASRDGIKTGGACEGDRFCASGVCLRGFCSKKCTSFADCPPFWKCESGASAFDKHCQRDKLN